MNALTTDLALLFLRVSSAALMLFIHGLPKLLHFQQELSRIEDPLHLGPYITLTLAIFAETICPLFVALGIFTRLACLPVLVVLVIAMLLVHPDWSLADGQFGWLFLVLFITITMAGPGRFSIAKWPAWRPVPEVAV